MELENLIQWRCIVIEILYVVIGVIAGAIIGYYIRRNIGEGKINNAENLAKNILDDAKRDGEAHKKELLLEAKEDIHKMRTEVEKENRERRSEIQRLEKRVITKEETVDKRAESLERKEDKLSKKVKTLEDKELLIDELYEDQLKELERLSGLTSEEAKSILLDGIQKEISHESAVMIKEMENQTKQEADKRGREIISTAIQRFAANHVAETTVTVVTLPNDEMKGRIIGREGRNIRALETLTGIEIGRASCRE